MLTSDLTPWIKVRFSKFKYHYTTISQKDYNNSKTMAPRSFNQAFKSKVVEDAIRDGNWCQVASQHGIHESTVRAWLKASDRHSEARRNNPISRRLSARRAAFPASRTTRVPTVASRPRNPFYPIVETGVLQFIDRKRSEEGFTYTRKKIQDEAKRISRENGIHEFKASVGWYNNFMSRNGLSTMLLNNGAPAENEDEPVEEVGASAVDPPVAEVEDSQSDQAILPQGEPSGQSEVERGAVPEVQGSHSQSDQAIHPHGEPGGQSAGERGGVPEVEGSHPTGHDQSPADPENFHEVAQKSSELLELVLNLQESYNPVWLPIASEEEEGRLNQLSLDSGVQPPSLLDQLDQVIGLSPEALENISLSELETTLVDPLWPPLPSSSPPWCAGYFLVENSIV